MSGGGGYIHYYVKFSQPWLPFLQNVYTHVCSCHEGNRDRDENEGANEVEKANDEGARLQGVAEAAAWQKRHDWKVWKISASEKVCQGNVNALSLSQFCVLPSEISVCLLQLPLSGYLNTCWDSPKAKKHMGTVRFMLCKRSQLGDILNPSRTNIAKLRNWPN